MGQRARVPLRCRRPGVHLRRVPEVRPDDPEPGSDGFTAAVITGSRPTDDDRCYEPSPEIPVGYNPARFQHTHLGDGPGAGHSSKAALAPEQLRLDRWTRHALDDRSSG